MTGRELVPIDPESYARDKARVEQGFWNKVRRTLGHVPFVEEAVAAYYCAMDPQTPLQVKAILIGALAYFVVPTDMIPDFIAWFGFAAFDRPNSEPLRQPVSPTASAKAQLQTKPIEQIRVGDWYSTVTVRVPRLSAASPSTGSASDAGAP